MTPGGSYTPPPPSSGNSGNQGGGYIAPPGSRGSSVYGTNTVNAPGSGGTVGAPAGGSVYVPSGTVVMPAPPSNDVRLDPTQRGPRGGSNGGLEPQKTPPVKIELPNLPPSGNQGAPLPMPNRKQQQLILPNQQPMPGGVGPSPKGGLPPPPPPGR